MNKILAIHHAQIMIPVGQEDKAREFYCQLLGLTEIEKPAALKVRGGIWLEVGEQQLHLGINTKVSIDAKGAENPALSRAHIAYRVEDIATWRQKLKAASIEIIDGEPVVGLSRFEFRDPFGNRIEFLGQ
jgi:catechol 2,3-dioxygenase-like lactoylglutathione lyase family enzyme